MSVRIINSSKRDRTFANRLLAVIPTVDEIAFKPEWIEVSPDHTVARLGCYDYDGSQYTDYILHIHGYNVSIYSAEYDWEAGVYQGEFHLV